MRFADWLGPLLNPERIILGESILALIKQAEACGLLNVDALAAREFVEYNEYGLAFEHVVDQLYEYGITVNAEFYRLLKAIADRMKLPEQRFVFISELIK